MRPLGVTLIGVYQILRGLLSAFFALAIMAFSDLAAKLASMAAEGHALQRFLSSFGQFAAVVILIAAACHIVVGIGVLRLRNWARLLTLLFSAIGLVLLLPFLHGFFPLIFALINGATIIYLILPPARRAFRALEDEKPLRMAA